MCRWESLGGCLPQEDLNAIQEALLEVLGHQGGYQIEQGASDQQVRCLNRLEDRRITKRMKVDLHAWLRHQAGRKTHPRNL